MKVPGEPGVYFCARHKSVQTRLRCGKCETPICPKCTTHGPTGARCPVCLSNRASHIYQIAPPQFLIAFAVAFACSILASLAIRFIGFFALFYALIVGTFIGKLVVRATGGKRGSALAVVSSLGVVCGGLLPLGFLLFGGSPSAQFFNPLVWIYIVLAILGVWYWVK